MEACADRFWIGFAYFLFPYLVTTFLVGFVFKLKLNYVDGILSTYPAAAWSYVCVALVMGIHGNIGAHAVLRMRPWYPRLKWFLVAILAPIPLCAALGYLNGGSVLYRAWIEGKLEPDDLPHTLANAQREFIFSSHLSVYMSLTALFAFVFLARAVRLRIMEKNKTIHVITRTERLSR